MASSKYNGRHKQLSNETSQFGRMQASFRTRNLYKKAWDMLEKPVQVSKRRKIWGAPKADSSSKL